MELKGKRLLVLGGTNNANDIHDFAEREGIKIVVAGSYFSTEIEEIADEKYYVDIYDTEQLKKVIKEHNIDGIFCGGNEDIISRVIDVAEEMGYPFYSSRILWDTLMNKKRFKEACIEYNVPTVNGYSVDEHDLYKSARELPYPVVVKPVDNSGSTGVRKCCNVDEFIEFYNNAKELSKSNEAIVEDYIEGDNIIVYYTFVDGNVTLSSMADKYMRGNSCEFNPLAEVHAYPSRHLPAYVKDVDAQMRNMLLGLGIKNGITSMQGFVREGRFYFFEMGYRLGGTAQYRYTAKLNNINSLHMMMAYALTGKMTGYVQGNDNAFFDKPCCTLTLMSKGGKVGKIIGLEEARKKQGVIYIENRYKEGDTIKVTGNVSQFHFRAYLVGKTIEDVKNLISYIQSTIKAYDEKGESMLITDFDVNRLDFGDVKFARGGYRVIVILPFLTALDNNQGSKMLGRAA